ncbi:hypothetical protein ABZ464_43160 [Streptomyces sp. NPDC005820]|uniref:hypothetical protein n=1 Tax=Streptomyces sp. NPDC005820 TaxID=3157069 RepID=UPI0034006839
MTQPTQPGPPVPPPVPYGRPPGPPADPGAASDRVSGGLLLLGAVLAVIGSFTTLSTSRQTFSSSSDGTVFRTVAKAWSYTTSYPGEDTESVTQFDGVPLLIGSLLAIAAAVLLFTGSGGRQPSARVLGVTGAALLFGTTLTVAIAAIGDTQWDTDSRSTTFGPGFYLLVVACLLALAATVLTVLNSRRPAVAAVPAPYPQPWPTGPVPQAYPPFQPQPYQPVQQQPYPPVQPPQPPLQPPAPPAS